MIHASYCYLTVYFFRTLAYLCKLFVLLSRCLVQVSLTIFASSMERKGGQKRQEIEPRVIGRKLH